MVKIRRKRITESISELINHDGVCRTAPATPGLLKRFTVSVSHKMFAKIVNSYRLTTSFVLGHYLCGENVEM